MWDDLSLISGLISRKINVWDDIATTGSLRNQSCERRYHPIFMKIISLTLVVAQIHHTNNKIPPKSLLLFSCSLQEECIQHEINLYIKQNVFMLIRKISFVYHAFTFP
jgi:hypothetical protein